MVARVVEKGDGEITVKYTSESPFEGLIMAMASMGAVSQVSLGTNSGYDSKALVSFGGFTIKAVEDMQPKKEGVK